MRGMATLPHANQEPLVVKNKVVRPQMSFGQASPWNEIFFPSVLSHCWLGDRKGMATLIRPVKRSLASLNRLTEVHLEKWPLKER